MASLTGPADVYAVERRRQGTVDAYRILAANDPLRWSSVAAALREGPEVGRLLERVLRESDLDAFFWECRPWPADADPPFEFVLAPAPALSGTVADPRAFAAHFDDHLAVAFDSLGGDARLVAPCPRGTGDPAPHLAPFLRGADPARIEALWRTVGGEIGAWRRARRGTLWLSTSGLGVPWLHVRLDSRPKYYTHIPYRSSHA